jgi:hypothetical protein
MGILKSESSSLSHSNTSYVVLQHTVEKIHNAFCHEFQDIPSLSHTYLSFFPFTHCLSVPSHAPPSLAATSPSPDLSASYAYALMKRPPDWPAYIGIKGYAAGLRAVESQYALRERERADSVVQDKLQVGAKKVEGDVRGVWMEGLCVACRGGRGGVAGNGGVEAEDGAEKQRCLNSRKRVCGVFDGSLEVWRR